MVLYSYVLNGYVVEEVIGRGALDHRPWGRGGVPTHLPLDYGRQNSFDVTETCGVCPSADGGQLGNTDGGAAGSGTRGWDAWGRNKGRKLFPGNVSRGTGE
jgi:hypothetical protein